MRWRGGAIAAIHVAGDNLVPFLRTPRLVPLADAIRDEKPDLIFLRCLQSGRLRL